jgi:hypothetical protein
VRRLREFQEIALILEGHRAPALVVATAGDRAWLEPMGDPQLVLAALPTSAHLAFTQENQYVLLSGRAERHPSGTIQFRGEVGLHLRNLRSAARLPIALAVHVEGTGEPIRTTDIGRGGLHLGAPPLTGAAGDEVALRIEMPDQVADVDARARIVRKDAQGTALAFVDLDPAQADRLEAIVIAVRRRIAQTRIQAAARPSPGSARSPG